MGINNMLKILNRLNQKDNNGGKAIYRAITIKINKQNLIIILFSNPLFF